MSSTSKQTDLLDICHSRVKNYADSRYNTNQYVRGKENPDYSKAAVLVPIFVKEGSLHILLTLRSEELPTHKGQVAFPGGKEEDDDKDIIATALREAEEEVGLSPDIVEVVAVLCPLVSIARDKKMYIYPVIGIIKSNFDLIINTSEVQTTFDVPLDFFLRNDTHRRDTMTFKGKEVAITLFDYETITGDQTEPVRFIIWGLTGSICLKVAVTALNKLPDFELDEYYSDLVKYITDLNSQEHEVKRLSKM